MQAEELPPIPVTRYNDLQATYRYIAIPSDTSVDLILELERYDYVGVLYSPGQIQEERDKLLKQGLIQQAIYF